MTNAAKNAALVKIASPRLRTGAPLAVLFIPPKELATVLVVTKPPRSFLDQHQIRLLVTMTNAAKNAALVKIASPRLPTGASFAVLFIPPRELATVLPVTKPQRSFLDKHQIRLLVAMTNAAKNAALVKIASPRLRTGAPLAVLFIPPKELATVLLVTKPPRSFLDKHQICLLVTMTNAAKNAALVKIASTWLQTDALLAVRFTLPRELATLQTPIKI